MLIREIRDDDLPAIFSWFETRKWPLPPIVGAGPRMGLVSENGGEPVACIWMYITGTSLVEVDWLGTSPELTPVQASLATVSLIEHLKRMARISSGQNKVRALRFYTKNDKLAKLFEGRGFKKSPEYYRLLWTQKD